jgi:D-arabinose 1-dehydrogenase-like Zn-dependent alcohol dehydrogenase
MEGNCVECGFPVAVQKTGKIACPYCSTINSAVTAGTNPGKWLSVGFIVLLGVIAIKAAKQGA